MIDFQHLDWDSTFFGFRIGKIKVCSTNYDKIEALLQEHKKENYQLIYLISDKPLEQYTPSLVDKKVTFTFESFVHDYTENKALISLAEDYILDKKLLDLTIQSGEYSRFRLDPKFPDGSFEKMYRKWIENSLNKSIADEVIVFKHNDKIEGFVSYKAYNDKLVIGLIAVDTASRGKQIGTKLVDFIKSKSQKLDKKSIEVVTQMDNIHACNFYKKNNFEIHSLEYIYHIHL
jgi:dTDP-4-amino-4,6-dideoxy-D-galactose acyltransferase